jgi:hypothetical protein
MDLTDVECCYRSQESTGVGQAIRMNGTDLQDLKRVSIMRRDFWQLIQTEKHKNVV